jgi:hypothetical protein
MIPTRLLAVLLAALLAVHCAGGNDALPEPAVKWEPALPAMTPMSAPNPVCIPQMDRASAQPRKVRHVSPRFPTRRTPTRFSSAMWVGVAEIDVDGSVSRVRTVRPIKADPPWPEFEDAFPAAIRQWKYQPRCVDGQPVKVELRVVGNIDFR